MITFLPYADFTKSAACLDYRRLGKQRVEAYQILQNVIGESKNWINHPAVKMWMGYPVALAVYGTIICIEWIKRGYEDNMLFLFDTQGEAIIPPWIGNEDFHRSHRANLVKKDPLHYGPLFGDLPWEEYIWPVT